MVRFDRFDLDLRPERTALLVVDMVDEFVAEGGAIETPKAREMVPRLRTVIERSRDAGVRIVYVKPHNRASGVDAGPFLQITPAIEDGIYEETTIYDDLDVEAEDIVIEKHRYSAFFETELNSILQTLNISTVAVAGTQSHVCCDSTLRSAFFRGYDVVVLSDCVDTFDLQDQGWGDVSRETLNRVLFTTVATNFGEVLDGEAFLERIGER